MNVLSAIRAAMIAPERDKDDQSAPVGAHRIQPGSGPSASTFDHEVAVQAGRESERSRLSAALNAQGIKGNPNAMSATLDFAELMPDASANDIVGKVKAGVFPRGKSSVSEGGGADRMAARMRALLGAKNGAANKGEGGGRLLAMAQARYGKADEADGKTGAERMTANMRGVIAEGSSGGRRIG